MALVLKDRVRETSLTGGTGTLTLNGAVPGFQAFSVIGNSNTTYYAIVDNATGEFEVGLGTYTLSGTTLSRDSILESSSGGSAINFSGNIKDVFCTYPAERSVYVDGSGIVPATAAILGVANGGTGITSFGTGVATFLGTPSSANLAAAVTDETGSGSLVFATSPTLVTPILGTPQSGTVTNLTGTASININGTVGATTPAAGSFTTLGASSTATFAAGAVGTPAITTTGDTNTGIFFPAADTIAFAEGGAEAMRITSAGEVLVGGTTEISGVSALTIQRPDAVAILNLHRNDTSINSGGQIGSIAFYGSDTTSNTPTVHASIQAVASGTLAAGDNPTDLVFATTADGSATVAEVARFTESKYLRFASGTGGIQFGGDTAAANALDDYEEGTWTPTYTNVTLGNGTRSGTYTKIGRLCYATAFLLWGSTTSSSGEWSITNLPFTPSGTGGGDALLVDTGTAIYVVSAILSPYIYGSVVKVSDGTGAGLVGSASPFTWANTDVFQLTFVYETT